MTDTAVTEALIQAQALALHYRLQRDEYLQMLREANKERAQLQEKLASLRPHFEPVYENELCSWCQRPLRHSLVSLVRQDATTYTQRQYRFCSAKHLQAYQRRWLGYKHA